MSVLNNLDFPHGSITSDKPELREWMLDLDMHAKLRKKYAAVALEQSKLMARQRALRASPATEAKDEQLDLVISKLNKLDIRTSEFKEQMAEIEGRSMTFVPSDSHDAKVMLLFIASVLEFGSKIDTDYLADVLVGCSEALEAKTPIAKLVGHGFITSRESVSRVG